MLESLAITFQFPDAARKDKAWFPRVILQNNHLWQRNRTTDSIIQDGGTQEILKSSVPCVNDTKKALTAYK